MNGPLPHRFTWREVNPDECTTCSRLRIDHPEPVQAIRNMMRGMHHRPAPGSVQVGDEWLADCGRTVTEVEVVKLEKVDKADGCRKCFRRASDRP